MSISGDKPKKKFWREVQHKASDRIKELKLHYRALGLRGLSSIIVCRVTNRERRFFVEVYKKPLCLRIPSSDVEVYKQVFMRNEYEFKVNREPKFIVDAGANIGLASIYFANRFPSAKIIAIEPEGNNFRLLRENCSAYPNIITLKCALWGCNTRLHISNPESAYWGFIMAQQSADSSLSDGSEVQGVTMDEIFSKFDIDRLDIAKIDIEGAEKEVFDGTHDWIEKTDALIVELHECFKHGCNRSFYNATNGFENEWTQGENIYISRSSGCIVR